MADISCIIAAFNEAPTIAQVIKGVVSNTPDLLEVIVVDDGSTDNTGIEAAKAGARVIQMKKNSGKGTAIRRGLVEARGDILLLIDADGQDDPAEIPVLIRAMTPDVDMVIGSRFLGTFREGAITKLNRFGNLLLTAIFRLLYRSPITDAQAGFRLVRRSAIDPKRLSAIRYEIEADLTAQVAMSKGKIVEVPVTRSKRVFGHSGFRSFYHGLRILAWMIWCRYKHYFIRSF